MPDAAVAPIVVVDGLCVRFGDYLALEDLTFDVMEGEFIAIVGPNGSGKTTLLKTLLGLVEPERGHVRVFGEPPGRSGRQVAGYVPQVKALDRRFPAQAVELVLSGLHRRWSFWPSASDREQALESLRGVGAEHLAERTLGKLSGGELQRVYLARSLIRTPRVVVLDEPATGVDAAGTSDLYSLLDAYQRQRQATVLMVTHDWNAALHHATRVLVMDKTLISYGPPREALNEEHLRRAFGHVGHAHAMLTGGHRHD